MNIKGVKQEEAIHIFYNIHSENLETLSFSTKVYRVRIEIKTNMLSRILGIDRLEDELFVFPSIELIKEEIAYLICMSGVWTWFRKLKAHSCTLHAFFLHKIFTYNLFPTYQKLGMENHEVYMIYNILTGKPVDIPVIICYIIITGSSTMSRVKGLPYGVMIIALMEICGVPFPLDVKVVKQGTVINDSMVQKMQQ